MRRDRPRFLNGEDSPGLTGSLRCSLLRGFKAKSAIPLGEFEPGDGGPMSLIASSFGLEIHMGDGKGPVS